MFKAPLHLYVVQKERNQVQITRKESNARLVVTKGYGVQEMTIGGTNAFAPTLCFV